MKPKSWRLYVKQADAPAGAALAKSLVRGALRPRPLGGVRDAS